jgi:glycerol-3-phosphate dehydrogenase
LARSDSKTETLHLQGWTDDVLTGPLAIYGSDASEIRQLFTLNPEWGEPIHPSLSDLKAEVIWAARFELARSVEDVLARRTRSLFLDARASLEAAPLVASLLANELGRDEAWQADQVESFRSLATGYLPI